MRWCLRGGIGEHDAQSRVDILSGMENLGISMNFERNQAGGNAMRRVDASESKTKVFVVPAKEDWMIAVHVKELARAER